MPVLRQENNKDLDTNLILDTIGHKNYQESDFAKWCMFSGHLIS